MDITKYIPYGENSAISRSELENLTGLADRQNRLLIEDARKRGASIISTHKGYYITEDINAIAAFLHGIDKRMTSMPITFLPMRRALAKAKGEKITEVRQHFRCLGMNNCEGQMSLESEENTNEI